MSNANDWFNFNQFGVPIAGLPILLIKQVLNTTSVWTQKTTMFRALMITYYVYCAPAGCAAAGATPLLWKMLNHCPTATPQCANNAPQALSGVVEDLNFTYDLVDGVTNPTNVTGLPITLSGVTYNSNQIRKVNVHMGVRSEFMSRPLHDYIRNHVNTSVDIRNLASVNRYDTN
jgi:hypothetical protein